MKTGSNGIETLESRTNHLGCGRLAWEDVMEIFQHLLVISNSMREDEAQLIKDAMEQNPDVRVRLSLLHIVPDVPSCYYQLPSLVKYSEKCNAEGEKTPLTLGKILNVPEEDRLMKNCFTETEVMKLAERMCVDVIVSSKNQEAEIPVVSENKKQKRKTRKANRIPCVKLDGSLSEIIGGIIIKGGLMAS